MDSDSPLDAFERILEQHPDPAWIYELDSLRLLAVNRATVDMTGRSREDLLRSTFLDLLAPGESDRIRRIITRARLEAPPWPLREKLKCRGPEGRVVELALASHSIETQGRRCRLLIARPRSPERETGERVRPDRRHDSLTGLPDRSLMLERIRRRVAQARQAPGLPFAVFVIDIDRFRFFNRNLGLEAGDRLLGAVAKRLESFVQSDETLVRLRADEFALLLDGIGTAEAAHHMAREIQEALEAPLAVNDHDVRLTASVGMAIGRPEADPPDELLEDAEVALHEAQASGVRGRRLYEAEMGVQAKHALRLEEDLGPGLERGDLKVRYQPLVALATGTVAGFEALARWQHPDLGLIMPDQFIAMAERTGQIGDLGHRIMRDACFQVAEWQRRFPSDPPLFLTVNCSSTQFFDPKLAMLVKRALAETGFPPKRLKLELTESVLMEDNPRTMEPFERILELGVQIIIDDFGTGFSSLSRLHELPIEALKIDRAFVSRLTERLDSLSVVRAIVQLARNFGLQVTAEGIENLEQLRALRLLKCDFGQGYYFAKPLDATQAEALLRSDQRW
ncbi:MAG TPA: sensor domain-containing phosphodiesterase [Planctomycetota bacterium]|nr:sensor domain-containing phosphodiesterase [Planctomycetota bacterium]